MIETFYTIKESEYTAEFVEKKSKFIATLAKVNTEEDAMDKLNEIRKKYRDAKHHVFSYRIANGAERFSDDGEPSGTAGVPILDILRGEQLQNILVVVTRYFGGILLGTGGLVKAYSNATKDAIKKSEKCEMKLCYKYHLEVDYNYLNILLHYFKEQSIIVRDTIFSDKIQMSVIVKKNQSEEILAKLAEKTERTTKIMSFEIIYHE